MPAGNREAESPTTTAALNQIQKLLDQIAREAEQDIPEREFFDRLLKHCVQATAALGGAVWFEDAPSGFFKTISEVNFPGVLTANLQAEEAHSQLLTTAGKSLHPSCIPRSVASHDGSTEANHQDFLLLFCPVHSETQQSLCIELVLRRNISPATQEGFQNFLAAVSQIAENYQRWSELRKLRRGEISWRELFQFAIDVHRNNAFDETAYAVTNGCRKISGCDRVSLLECRGESCKAVSFSGVDRVDRRSPLVQRLQELVRAVIPAKEAMWFGDETEPLPPELEKPLHEFQIAGQARNVAVVPLFRRSKPGTNGRPSAFAALIFEWMRAQPLDFVIREQVKFIATAAESALVQADQFRSIPFSRLTSRLQSRNSSTSTSSWGKRILLALIAIVCLTFLCLIPRPFMISSLGELRPTRERRIFAVDDGIIQSVHVNHGDDCRTGDLLITMANSQLEFERKRVDGDLETTRARLKSVRADYLGLDRSQLDADRRYEQLTAEEQELREKIAGLEEQLAILNSRKDKLKIHSPIDGRVLTWDAEQTLRDRPVQHGQTLLTVADLDGPWSVNLHLAEEDIGYLIAAQDELGTQRPVTFMLESEPGKTYSGRLETMSTSTHFDEWESAGVLLTVKIDSAQKFPFRSGARVRAKIDGGQRSLAFVWLHDLYAAVQRWLLF